MDYGFDLYTAPSMRTNAHQGRREMLLIPFRIAPCRASPFDLTSPCRTGPPYPLPTPRRFTTRTQGRALAAVVPAAYGARVAAENALNGDSRRYDNSVMPEVVFTDPQVATVGLTEAAAKTQGMSCNRFGPETQVGIIDRHYRFVARIPDPEGRLGTPASESWQAAIARSRQGFADIVTLEGKPTLAAYVLTRDGWTAGLFVPNIVLEAPVRGILYSMGLLSLTMTLASLGFALCLGRRLSVVMSGLVTSAQRVGRGEIVEKESFPVHEATAISEALHATSEELTSRNAALRESEIRFRGTFENAAVGVAHVGLDGKFLMVNQRLCEILGYPREELQTRAYGRPKARSHGRNGVRLKGDVLDPGYPQHPFRRRLRRGGNFAHGKTID